jgi:hypothetical protein
MFNVSTLSLCDVIVCIYTTAHILHLFLSSVSRYFVMHSHRIISHKNFACLDLLIFLCKCTRNAMQYNAH